MKLTITTKQAVIPLKAYNKPPTAGPIMEATCQIPVFQVDEFA
jgi:hypothetical protein